MMPLGINLDRFALILLRKHNKLLSRSLQTETRSKDKHANWLVSIRTDKCEVRYFWDCLLDWLENSNDFIPELYYRGEVSFLDGKETDCIELFDLQLLGKMKEEGLEVIESFHNICACQVI